MNLTKLLIIVVTTGIAMAVLNRIAFTRALVGTDAAESFF